MSHMSRYSFTSGALTLLSVLFIAACVSTVKRQPANAIHNDIHNSGTRLAFNESSTKFASAGIEGWVFTWHLPSMQKQAGWAAHTDEITGLAFLTDNQLLSTALDGVIKKWSDKGTVLAETSVGAGISALALDNTRDRLLIGLENGVIQQRQLSTLALLGQVKFSSQSIRALAISLDARYFAAADDHAKTAIWDATGERRDLDKSSSYSRTLIFDENDSVLIGAGWYNLFRWNLSDGGLTEYETEHQGIISGIELTPDRAQLLSISRQTDFAVLLIDPKTGATRHRLQNHELCGGDVSMSPDGRFIVSTADDASVRIWDMKNPLPMQ